MEKVDITEVMLPEMTILDRETFSGKEEVFAFMSEKFAENKIVTDAKKFEEALYKREEEGPTYIGNLLAIPHGICDEVVRPGIGFCRVNTPFIYRSHGEEGEVKYIFTLAVVGEEGKMEHLRILASLAGILAHDEFIEALGKVESYEEIIDEINKVKEEV
ncbi:MAG: PTS sugar transporter subunit IIA [Lachnospiraceae bacterium]